MICVQHSNEKELVEISFNREGLDNFIAYLNELKSLNVKNDETGILKHLHLFSDEWGGYELTGEKINLDHDFNIIHHLRINLVE